MLSTVCEGIIVDCEFLLTHIRPANLSPATRLRFSSGLHNTIGRHTKAVSAKHVIGFLSRRLDGLHIWVEQFNSPKRNITREDNSTLPYKHLLKYSTVAAAGPADAVSHSWCEVEDLRCSLLEKCHKGGLRVYALNAFDVLVSSLTRPQQARLILMRLLESFSNRWRTMTGRRSCINDVEDSDFVSRTCNSISEKCGLVHVNYNTVVSPTLMHHLDGLAGCGVAIETSVSSAYFRVLSRVVHCFQYGEPSQQLLTLPLLGVACRTEDDWKQIQDAGILNILASLVGQKRKEAIEEYETELMQQSEHNIQDAARHRRSMNRRAASMEIVSLGAPSPEVLRFLSTHSVTSISAGERNAAFVTSGGQVYAHGANIAGSCGTGTGRNLSTRNNGTATGASFDPISEPRHLQAVAGTRVVKAIVGGNMCINDPSLVRRSRSANGGGIGGSAGSRIDGANNDFIVLLSASGDVFTAGANDYGQLGRGVGAPTSDLPMAIPGLAKVRINMIAVGWHHIIAISHGPRVDSRNLHPTNSGTTSVDFGSAALTTAAYPSSHRKQSMDSLQMGTIFTWGSNEHGQLGLGFTSTQECSPRSLLPLFGDKLPGVQSLSITGVAAGASHSLFTCCIQTDTHNHHLLVGCGSNAEGQLGADGTLLSCRDFMKEDFFASDRPIRPKLSKLLEKQQRVNMNKPDTVRNSNNKGNHHDKWNVSSPSLSATFAFNHTAIENVSCGSFHSAILTTCGTLFCFGENTACQCQPHNELPSHHPLHQSLLPAISTSSEQCICLKVLPVALPGPVKSVALGRSYTVAVVSNYKNSQGISPVYGFWSRSDAYVETHTMYPGSHSNNYSMKMTSKHQFSRSGLSESTHYHEETNRQHVDTSSSSTPMVNGFNTASKDNPIIIKLSETELFLLYFFIRCGLPPSVHRRYLLGFKSAGFAKTSHLQQLDDKGLRRIGVAATGHRRLILQQISAETQARDVPTREDVWGWGCVPRTTVSKSHSGFHTMQDVFSEPTLLLTRDIEQRNTPWSEVFAGSSKAIYILQLPPSLKLSKEATQLALKRRLSTGTWAVFQLLAINTAKFSNYTHDNKATSDFKVSMKPTPSISQSKFDSVVSKHGAAVAAEDAVLDCLMHELTELAGHKDRDICTGLMHDVLKLLHQYCVISKRAVSRLANTQTISLVLRMIMARESADVAVQCIHFAYILLPVAGPSVVAQTIAGNPEIWPSVDLQQWHEKALDTVEIMKKDVSANPRLQRFTSPVGDLIHDGTHSPSNHHNDTDDADYSEIPSHSSALKYVPPSVAASFLLQLVGHGLYRPPINLSEDIEEQEDVIMAASGSLTGTRIDMIVTSELVVLIRKLLNIQVPHSASNGIANYSNNSFNWFSAINTALQEALCKPLMYQYNEQSPTPTIGLNPTRAQREHKSSVADTPCSKTDEKEIYAQLRRHRRRSTFVPRSQNRRQAFSNVDEYTPSDFKRDSLVVQRIWRLLGALCALGGDTEVLRDQCHAYLYLPSGVKKPARVFQYNAWSATVALGEEFSQSSAGSSSPICSNSSIQEDSNKVSDQEDENISSHDVTVTPVISRNYRYIFDVDAAKKAVPINLKDVQIEVVQQVPVPVSRIEAKGSLLFSLHQLLLGTHPVQLAAPLSNSNDALSTSFTAVTHLFVQQTRMRSCKAFGCLLHDGTCLAAAIDNGYIDSLTKIAQFENPHAAAHSDMEEDSTSKRRISEKSVAKKLDLDPCDRDPRVTGAHITEYTLEHHWIALQHHRRQVFEPLARLVLNSGSGTVRSYHLHVQLHSLVGLQLLDTLSSAPQIFCTGTLVKNEIGLPHNDKSFSNGGVPTMSPMPITTHTQFTSLIRVDRDTEEQFSIILNQEEGALDFLVLDVASSILCVDVWVRSCGAGDGVTEEEEKRKCHGDVPVKAQFLGQVIIPVYQLLLSNIDFVTGSKQESKNTDKNEREGQVYRFPLSTLGCTSAQLGAISMSMVLEIPSRPKIDHIRQSIIERQNRLLPLTVPNTIIETAQHLHGDAVDAANSTIPADATEAAVAAAGYAATAEIQMQAVATAYFDKVDFNGHGLSRSCNIPLDVIEWTETIFPHDNQKHHRTRKVLSFVPDANPSQCFVAFTHSLDFQNRYTVASKQMYAYLNRYSIILDVKFAKGTLGTQDEKSPTRYYSLLQTSFGSNQDTKPGSWFVRSDGIPGCCAYGRQKVSDDAINPKLSEQVSIQAGRWHRLVMTVDTLEGKVLYFVDGKLATELIHTEGDESKMDICILPDDRWSLDKTFALFRDGNSHSACPASIMQVSSFQLRDYTMTNAAVTRLGGPSASGIVAPSNSESAAALCMLLDEPRKYDFSRCAAALRAVNYRRVEAIVWLRTQGQRLQYNTQIENTALATGLGISCDTVHDMFEQSDHDVIDCVMRLMAEPFTLGEHEGDRKVAYSLQAIQGQGNARSNMYRLQSQNLRHTSTLIAEAEVAAAASLGGGLSKSAYDLFDAQFQKKSPHDSTSSDQRSTEQLTDGGVARTFHLKTAAGVRGNDSEAAIAVAKLASAVLRCTRQLVHSLAASAIMRLVVNASHQHLQSPFRYQFRRLLLDGRESMTYDNFLKATGHSVAKKNNADQKHARTRFLRNFLDFLSDSLIQNGSGKTSRLHYSAIHPEDLHSNEGTRTIVMTTTADVAVSALSTVLQQELLLATDPSMLQRYDITSEKKSDNSSTLIKRKNGCDGIHVRTSNDGAQSTRSLMKNSHLLTKLIAAEAIVSMVSSLTMSSSIVAHPITKWRCVWGGLGSRSASIWNPLLPPKELLGFNNVSAQWVLLGDVATIGHAHPGSNSECLAYAFCAQDGIFAPPLKFRRVWHSTNWDSNFVLWEMVPPDGYVCMGCIATLQDAKPPGYDGAETPYRCVRKDMVKSITPHEKIWSTPSSPVDSSCALFTIGNLGSTFCATIPGEEDMIAYHLATPPMRFNHHSESIAVWLLHLLICVSQARQKMKQNVQMHVSIVQEQTDQFTSPPVLFSPHLIRTLWITAERALLVQNQKVNVHDSAAVVHQVSGFGRYRFKWLRLLSSVLRMSGSRTTNEKWRTRITDQYEDELDVMFMNLADEQSASKHKQKLSSNAISNANFIGNENRLSQCDLCLRQAWSSYVQILLELVVGTRIQYMDMKMLNTVDEFDYDVSSDADWLCTTVWLRKYVECAQLIQSLADRSAGFVKNQRSLSSMQIKAAKELPASFLASSDVFGPYFGVCQAQMIQSEHPYSRMMESQQFDVKLPDANSLEIHFDPRCSTGPGDMLRLYLLEQNKNLKESPTRRAFAQREGHKSDFPKEPLLLKNLTENAIDNDENETANMMQSKPRIVGILCEFPQRLAWGLKPVGISNGSSNNGIAVGAGILLEKGYRCASYTKPPRGLSGRWRTVFGNVTFAHGHHYWEVRVDICKFGRLMFGIGAEGALEQINGSSHEHYFVSKNRKSIIILTYFSADALFIAFILYLQISLFIKVYQKHSLNKVIFYLIFYICLFCFI